jgi:hypothetical protein
MGQRDADNKQISPDEMKTIIAAYKDSGHVLAEGFKVNGVKYTVLKVDGDSIYAKQVQQHNSLSSLWSMR